VDEESEEGRARVRGFPFSDISHLIAANSTLIFLKKKLRGKGAWGQGNKGAKEQGVRGGKVICICLCFNILNISLVDY